MSWKSTKKRYTYIYIYIYIYIRVIFHNLNDLWVGRDMW
jgi:hypothetical protein